LFCKNLKTGERGKVLPDLAVGGEGRQFILANAASKGRFRRPVKYQEGDAAAPEQVTHQSDREVEGCGAVILAASKRGEGLSNCPELDRSGWRIKEKGT